jgi:hypothetical protein
MMKIKLTTIAVGVAISFSASLCAYANGKPADAKPKAAKSSELSKDQKKKLLQLSDRSRGYINHGLKYTFDVTLTDEYGGSVTKKYDLDSYGDFCQAVSIQEDENSRRTILVNKDFVWLVRPNSQRPTPISVQERLTGLASVGDIMSNYFSRNYDVKSTKVEGEKPNQTAVIALDATNRLAAYQKVEATFDLSKNLVQKAVFFTPSGEALKTVMYFYEKTTTVNKETFPFVSKMTFFEGSKTDGKPAAEVIFGDVSLTDLKQDFFDVEKVMNRMNDKPK